jgi:hypothetical protein
VAACTRPIANSGTGFRSTINLLAWTGRKRRRPSPEPGSGRCFGDRSQAARKGSWTPAERLTVQYWAA